MRYDTYDIVIMAIVRIQMRPEGEILRGFCYGEDYMPRKPKRPCSYPGCPNLTDGRYCPEHQQKVNSNYEKYGRDKSTKKRYGRAWKRIRDARDISQLVIDTYSNQIGVFQTCIPLSVRAAEISAEGSSIYQYDPKGKAANAYRTLTEEVLDRG